MKKDIRHLLSPLYFAASVLKSYSEDQMRQPWRLVERIMGMHRSWSKLLLLVTVLTLETNAQAKQEISLAKSKSNETWFPWDVGICAELSILPNQHISVDIWIYLGFFLKENNVFWIKVTIVFLIAISSIQAIPASYLLLTHLQAVNWGQLCKNCVVWCFCSEHLLSAVWISISVLLCTSKLL